MEETNKLTKKNKITLIVGIVLFLILVLSASYAYFAITSINNATATTVTGRGEELGSPTLTTNTTSLKLNLTADLMSNNNARKKLYATTTGEAVIEEGSYPKVKTLTTPVTMGNGRYILATASVSTGNIRYNCDYNFDVSATVTNPITDRSDEDIHVIVTSPKGETYRYRLDELLEGAKTISGVISNLTPGENQEFTIESYVFDQTLYSQNDLSDNTYTVSVTPKSGTSGFSCTAVTEPVVTGFAKALIDSNKMVQTGLEGDGYRFQGTGDEEYCIYNNGKLYTKKIDNTCPTLYNFIRTRISDNVQTKFFYRTNCPADTATYTHECTTLTATLGNKPVNNYVCFGTSDKSTCTSNSNKYMYRVIGVFPDEEGNQHVKLIKMNTVGQYAWHSVTTKPVYWHDSDLYKGLNGSYFLTNTEYDYMQNTTWKNKIENWRWTESISGIVFRGSSFDYDVLSPMSYDSYTISTFLDIPYSQIYLHETNRESKKYKTGSWSYNNAKIGLMNTSDYYLSLPIIDEVGMYNTNNIFETHLVVSWLNPIKDNDSYLVEWTTSNRFNLGLDAYEIGQDANNLNITIENASNAHDVRSTFYLTSDVYVASGTGTESDPYILK